MRLLLKLAVPVIVVLAIFARDTSSPAPARAFDTGWHYAMMQQTFTPAAGWSGNAKNILTVSNWFIDYYSSGHRDGEYKHHSAELHFDDLFTFDDVGRRWDWLQQRAVLVFDQFGGQSGV